MGVALSSSTGNSLTDFKNEHTFDKNAELTVRSNNTALVLLLLLPQGEDPTPRNCNIAIELPFSRYSTTQINNNYLM